MFDNSTIKINDQRCKYIMPPFNKMSSLPHNAPSMQQNVLTSPLYTFSATKGPQFSTMRQCRLLSNETSTRLTSSDPHQAMSSLSGKMQWQFLLNPFLLRNLTVTPAVSLAFTCQIQKQLFLILFRFPLMHRFGNHLVVG